MADKTAEVLEKSPPSGTPLNPILDRSANDQFTKSQQDSAASCQSKLPSVEVTREPLTGGVEKHQRFWPFRIFGKGGAKHHKQALIEENAKFDSSPVEHKDKHASEPKQAKIEEFDRPLDAQQARPDTFCEDVHKNLFKGEIITICGEIPNKYKSLLRLSEFFSHFENDERRIRAYKRMMHSGLPSRYNPLGEWSAPGGYTLEPSWVFLYQMLPGKVQRQFEQMAAKHHMPITEDAVKPEKE